MAKSILDEILVQRTESSSFEEENKILKPLLEELEMITDDSIRSFTRSVLLKAKHFWDIPSSFSGKYHPADEHGIGGNLLHTKRVVRVASVISDSYSLVSEERDIVISACILHDVCKGIEKDDGDGCKYDPMHPYTVGRLVEQCQKDDKNFANESQSSTLYLGEEIVQSILRLIRSHLGPWSPIPETYPITYLDYIVHISDNIASKLHTFIEDSELINPKWKKNKD
jgi:hypothetical protein